MSDVLPAQFPSLLGPELEGGQSSMFNPAPQPYLFTGDNDMADIDMTDPAVAAIWEDMLATNDFGQGDFFELNNIPYPSILPTPTLDSLLAASLPISSPNSPPLDMNLLDARTIREYDTRDIEDRAQAPDTPLEQDASDDEEQAIHEAVVGSIRIRPKLTKAVREKRKVSSDVNQQRKAVINTSVMSFEATRFEQAKELAEKHGLSLHDANIKLGGPQTVKGTRAPNIYNGLVKHAMAHFNANRTTGNKLLLREVQALMKNDPAWSTDTVAACMVATCWPPVTCIETGNLAAVVGRSLTDEQKVALRKEMAEAREREATAQRPSPLSAAKLKALENLTGSIFLLLSSKGNIDSAVRSGVSASACVYAFSKDHLKLDIFDAAREMELYACARKKGAATRDSLDGLRTKVAQLVRTSMTIVTQMGSNKIPMSYGNYQVDIIETYWRPLTQAEKKKVVNEVRDRKAAGKSAKKAKATRSDAGKARGKQAGKASKQGDKRKSAGGTSGSSKRARIEDKGEGSSNGFKSRQFIYSDDDSGEEEGEDEDEDEVEE
ncbi:hypothetical protein FIBSPDRAFT_982672 [Athelia psychrophila]|uniref:Uncharacterized protein n=1 Tax=Athelia psychrophila TaxID=1759441 RepID=A0A166CDY4_9AGAM|nr:hypothetical protein FIBSPDRAFT_982672 [Fibularhizoctonia sp. CBS 109695]